MLLQGHLIFLQNLWTINKIHSFITVNIAFNTHYYNGVWSVWDMVPAPWTTEGRKRSHGRWRGVNGPVLTRSAQVTWTLYFFESVSSSAFLFDGWHGFSLSPGNFFLHKMPIYLMSQSTWNLEGLSLVMFHLCNLIWRNQGPGDYVIFFQDLGPEVMI